GRGAIAHVRAVGFAQRRHTHVATCRQREVLAPTRARHQRAARARHLRLTPALTRRREQWVREQRCGGLPFSVLCATVLFCVPLLCSSCHCCVLCSTVLFCVPLLCSVLCSTALFCVPLLCSACHCSVLRSTALTVFR